MTECAPAPDVVVTLRGETFRPDEGEFVLLDFNPWARSTRADAENPRAWADGNWSGAEWTAAVDVPLTILVRNLDRDPAGAGPGPNRGLPGTARWLALQQRLAAAFAPSHTDVPLEWTVPRPDGSGEDAYLLYGRPRLVDPAAETAYRGWALARCAFRALDPRVYAGGAASCTTLSLPAQTGGLVVGDVAMPGPPRLTLPLRISAVVSAGRASVTNRGTVPTPLQVQVNGPVTDPRLTVTSFTPSGSATLRYDGALTAGQFLAIDTGQHTVMLNGTSSRRGQVSGDWPMLQPGVNEVAFDAGIPDPAASMTACWRDAWI